MSSASLNIAVSSEVHQFLTEHGSECELWKELTNKAFISQMGYSSVYGDYFYPFVVNSRYDHEDLFVAVKDFLVSSYKAVNFEHEVDIDEFMEDNFGVTLLTDYGDYTQYEGNFDMGWNSYIAIIDFECEEGKFNIIELDQLFRERYGYGSMTLEGGRLLFSWLIAGEKLYDCMDELVYRCMANELTNLKPSERKKLYPSEVLEVSEKAFKGSVKRLQREFKKETGNRLKSGKANQMLAKVVYDKSAPEAKAIVKNSNKNNAVNSLGDFSIQFDIDEATAYHQLQIMDTAYSNDAIIEGLNAGSLVTTTWHNNEGRGAFIEELESGKSVARIHSQEIDANYSNFKLVNT